MSTLAWLDTDESQQRLMNELLEAFKDQSSVDELGIGVIRDAIANALFPGTSVLQTRVRYMLFVGWLLRDVARRGLPADRAASKLRASEVNLIESLITGGETTGVIGREARARLKRMPSAAYWAGLGTWGLRTWNVTLNGHLRAVSGHRDVTGDHTEEDAARSESRGLDPALPPMPEDLLTSATFDLTEGEANYLRDRIAVSCPGTLLAWLALEGRPADAGRNVWHHPQFAEFPDQHRNLVEHGRSFAHVIQGAPLLYNLMLAQKLEDEDSVEEYEFMLNAWRDGLAAEGTLKTWNTTEFWIRIRTLNPRLPMATQAFIMEWLAVAGSRGLASNGQARRLIATRERRLKGSRARLDNPKALDAWTGASGLVELDYRWFVAGRHLNDIYAGAGVE